MMSQGFKKVFLFEKKRFTLNRILIIALFSVIVIGFVYIYGYFTLQQTPPISDTPDHLLIDSYQKRVDYINDTLKQNPSVTIRQDLEHEKAKLMFYINTSTTQQDYISMSSLTEKTALYHGTTLMFRYFNAYIVFLIVLAIIIGIFSFGHDITRKSIKNMLNPISRMDILKGKVVYQFFLIFSVWIFFFLISSFFGLFSIDAKILVNNGDSWYSINAYFSFILQNIGVILLFSIIMLFIDYFIILFRNTFSGVSILVYGFILLLFSLIILQKQFDITNSPLVADRYLIFLNIFEIFKYFSLNSVIFICLYLLILVSLIFGLIRRMKKFCC